MNKLGADFSDKEKQIFANIELINSTILHGIGMDIVIISTTSSFQEEFWQNRLESTRGQIINEDAIVLAVHEDWYGGAGNGLGTLYAINKAISKAEETFNIDVLAKIQEGASVGLYHTAGKGTRLAPLPGSENNNKPGVKLPGLIFINDEAKPITILEAVIKQTSIYASSRKGRISVFWGDQIFIPCIDVQYTPSHHADILCFLGPMPDENEWNERDLDKYGLITVDQNNNAAQVEKISFNTAEKLIKDGILGVENGVGVSLGSFSISSAMVAALLNEFSVDLVEKNTKLDADPHFWMPMTLDIETYLNIMEEKNESRENAAAHYNRMSGFKKQLLTEHPELGIFGAVDVGIESYWWDYGQVKYYLKNSLKAVDQNHEGEAIRKFYNFHKHIDHSTIGNDVMVDENSFIITSKIKKGSVKNSLLIGVKADEINVENCVIIKVTVPGINATGSLLYNITEEQKLDLDKGTVRADSYIPFASHYALTTNIDRDGGEDWNEVLSGNELSYENLFNLNKEVDISQAEKFSGMEHQRVACVIFETIW